MSQKAIGTAETLERVKELSDQLDLDGLLEQSNIVVGNLQAIMQDESNLDALEEQSNTVAGNLHQIANDETDLDALEEQTGRILANLQGIAELLDRDDVSDALSK